MVATNGHSIKKSQQKQTKETKNPDSESGLRFLRFLLFQAIRAISRFGIGMVPSLWLRPAAQGFLRPFVANQRKCLSMNDLQLKLSISN